VCGVFLFDFLHDDIGHTKALKINTADAEAMGDLLKTLSRDEMHAHQAMLELYLNKRSK